MSTSITPAINAPPATYPIPAPGESVSSANTAQYVQPLADAIAWMRSKIPGINPSTALLDLSYPPTLILPGASDWQLSTLDTLVPAYYQSAQGGGAGFGISLPLDSALVTGQVIRAWSVDFIGKGGHAALPATMPQTKLYRYARGIGSATVAGSGGGETLLDSQADTSANAAAYQVAHTIGKVMGTPAVVDKSLYQYTLVIYGEYGANSLTGSVVLNTRLSVSG